MTHVSPNVGTGVAPWSPVLRRMKQWFTVAIKAVRMVARFVVGKMVVGASVLGVELQKATPSFAHVVGDDFWNPKLAHQSLLQRPRRQELNTLTSSLLMQLAACQRLHTQWGMAPALADDEHLRADVLSAQSIFGTAKLTLGVIACCNVLLEMSGAVRAEKADEMLSCGSKMSLSRALLSELQKVKVESPGT